MSRKLDKVLKEYTVRPYKGDQPERMLEWAAELESGKYGQLSGVLHNTRLDSKKRCCLGVACDLSNTGTWDKDGKYIPYESQYQPSMFVMPVPVSWFLGFANNDGCNENPNILDSRDTEGYDSLSQSFADLNDTFRLSFKDIAFIIRESVRLGKDGDK